LGLRQDNAFIDEFGAYLCKPVEWPIIADARLAAESDIDIAQTHKKYRFRIVSAHFSLFFFMF